MGGPWEPAVRAVEPAGRALGPAGRAPGANWEARIEARGAGRKRKTENRTAFLVCGSSIGHLPKRRNTGELLKHMSN